MRRLRPILLSALVLAAGCHRWVPVEDGPTPATGTEVRVRMTDAGSDELGRAWGDNDGILEGPMAYWEETEIGLLLRTSVRRQGFPSTLITDTVAVPADHVSGVDVKEIDNGRTTFLTAGIALGAVALIFATRALGEGHEVGDSDPPPPDASWIVRIPFSFGGR